MGIWFHIAEVAALLLLAYVVGWSIGVLLHLAVRPRARVEAIPAERLATAIGEAAPTDALVKAPVIVEVEKAPAPVRVAAAALAPAPEAPKPADPIVAEAAAPAPAPLVPAPASELVAPTPPPGPKVSAIETLRGLSSAMPLLPAEAVPVPPPAEPSPEPQQASPSSPPPMIEPAPAPVPASVAVIVAAPATAEVQAAVAAITAAVAEPAPPPPPIVPEASAPPPVPEPEIAAAPPMPASVPGQAWAGKIHGHEAPPLAPAPVEPATVELAPEPHPEPLAAKAPVGTPQPEMAEVKPLVVEEPAGLEASLLSIVEAHLPPEIKTVPDPLEDMLLTSVAGGLAIDAEAEAALSMPPPVQASPEPMTQGTAAASEQAEPEEVEVQPEQAEPSEPAPLVPEMVAVAPVLEPPYKQAPVEFDESAAMRDIEGGWSRRRTRAMTDASDVGAAVAAAQMAVESVLARNGVSADRQVGKPKGLPGPRDGQRDNLKRINGLGQLDESTLNNLGVYHFEQIAAWSAAEVLWLENHAFARGRIGQESWQQQAGALTAERAAQHAAR